MKGEKTIGDSEVWTIVIALVLGIGLVTYLAIYAGIQIYDKQSKDSFCTNLGYDYRYTEGIEKGYVMCCHYVDHVKSMKGCNAIAYGGD